MITGLHACGDLTPSLLKAFTCTPQIKACVLVGCCYYKMSPAGSSSTSSLWGVKDEIYPFKALCWEHRVDLLHIRLGRIRAWIIVFGIIRNVYGRGRLPIHRNYSGGESCSLFTHSHAPFIFPSISYVTQPRKNDGGRLRVSVAIPFQKSNPSFQCTALCRICLTFLTSDILVSAASSFCI